MAVGVIKVEMKKAHQIFHDTPHGNDLAIFLSTRMGWGINEFPALVALFGSPVAVSSAVMAGSMGADEQLATQLVVWTSLFSIVTIFSEVCILMSMGLLPAAAMIEIIIPPKILT